MIRTYEYRCRFIPAPAGNSYPKQITDKAPAVHPRACGEQFGSVLCGLVWVGSSPRLRGTVAICRTPVPRLRFIPAPAGNRLRLSFSETPPLVHPRACGEQSVCICRIRPCAGSSPRLRGTDLERGIGTAGLRFIPAPAGNSSGSFIFCSPNTVHPRACGEQGWP